ncbi:MAG: 2'-5' RNA ligase family protein [Planctomycetota bacterium]|jgi:2'-5' RNA ligase
MWETIQAIRRRYDRHVDRWMPHITLLYPFRPVADYDAAAPILASSCAEIPSFEITLARFDHFTHRTSCTMWLAPEPPASLISLQEALRSAFPDCDDVNRYPRGFQPHLSVGQVRNRTEVTPILNDLQSSWRPLTFRLEGVTLIRRGKDTGDVFVADRTIPLEGAVGRGGEG